MTMPSILTTFKGKTCSLFLVQREVAQVPLGHGFFFWFPNDADNPFTVSRRFPGVGIFSLEDLRRLCASEWIDRPALEWATVVEMEDKL